MRKTRKKSPTGRGGNPRGNPQNLVPGAGRGPKPGAPNAGRPPDEWRAKLRSFASRDEVLQHVETVLLAGPEHPYFDRALQYATDHGYGRASQPIEHNVGAQTLEALLAKSHEPTDQ